MITSLKGQRSSQSVAIYFYILKELTGSSLVLTQVVGKQMVVGLGDRWVGSCDVKTASAIMVEKNKCGRT